MSGPTVEDDAICFTRSELVRDRLLVYRLPEDRLDSGIPRHTPKLTGFLMGYSDGLLNFSGIQTRAMGLPYVSMLTLGVGSFTNAVGVFLDGRALRRKLRELLPYSAGAGVREDRGASEGQPPLHELGDRVLGADGEQVRPDIVETVERRGWLAKVTGKVAVLDTLETVAWYIAGYCAARPDIAANIIEKAQEYVGNLF